MPNFSPFTSVGYVQAEVHEVKRQLNDKVNSYEMSALEDKINRLENEQQRINSKLEKIEYDIVKLGMNQE